MEAPVGLFKRRKRLFIIVLIVLAAAEPVGYSFFERL